MQRWILSVTVKKLAAPSMLIAKRIHGLRSLQVIVGAVAAQLVFWGLFLLLAMSYGGVTQFWSRYVIYSGLVMLGFAVDYFKAARWESNFFENRLQKRAAWRMSLEQSFVIFVVLLGFLVAFKDLAISRLFLFGYVVALFTVLGLLNLWLPKWLGSRFFRGARCQKILLAGSMRDIQDMVPWLERNKGLGLVPVGALATEGAQSGDICGIPLIKGIDELPKTLQKLRVTLLMHISPHISPEEWAQLRSACDTSGARLVVTYNLGEEMASQTTIFSAGGRHFLTFRDEPLESPTNRLLKRGLDITVSLLVLTFILPVTAMLVWLLQKKQAPGPLFFRQNRGGLHNEEFIIYKFRTMYVDNPDPALQATSGDARVYPAGRWLRRLSIDEFPQFINVLLGEMSIVGPRPHMVTHDELFSRSDQRYRVRHFVKPGITGLAQVSGLRGETRQETDVVDRVSADLRYLENWSLGLDLSIIIRTAAHVVRAPRSAC